MPAPKNAILDPFKPYINQRWNDGITSATVLHTELQAQGCKGSTGGLPPLWG
ncbi:MAG TPA: hypothetical protein VII22_23355 [Streptosporangiaceae bacterium]